METGMGARPSAAARPRRASDDPFSAEEARAIGLTYVEFGTVLEESHFVTLHSPLTPQTRHLIDEAAIAWMRRGAMLVNTSCGAIVDTRAVIVGLKSSAIGLLGLDVYEEEGDLFFEHLSGQVLQDDVVARLLTFPKVLVTAHQAFFTAEALAAIADTTIANISSFEETGRAPHEVSTERLA